MTLLEGTPINDILRDLAGGRFLAQQRNAVLVDGSGKTHLAIAIARNYIHAGARD
jgi:DNA replication protein DnaC